MIIVILFVTAFSRKPHGEQIIGPLYNDENAFIPQTFTKTEQVNSDSIKIKIPQYCIFTLDNGNYFDMKVYAYINKSQNIECTGQKLFSKFKGVYFGNETGYIVLTNLRSVKSVTYNIALYPDTNNFYFFHESKCTAIDHVATYTSRIRAKYEKAMNTTLNTLAEQEQYQSAAERTEDVYLTWKASVGNLQSYIFDFMPYETKYIKYVQVSGQPMRTFDVSSNETLFARLGRLENGKYKHRAQMTSGSFRINLKIEDGVSKSEYIFFIENQCPRPARATILEYPLVREVCDFDPQRHVPEINSSEIDHFMSIFKAATPVESVNLSFFGVDVRDLRDSHFFQLWAGINGDTPIPRTEKQQKNRFSRLSSDYSGGDLQQRRMRDSIRNVIGKAAKEKFSSIIGAVTGEAIGIFGGGGDRGNNGEKKNEENTQKRFIAKWNTTATTAGTVVHRPFEERTVKVEPDVYNKVDTVGLRTVLFENTDDCDSIVLEDNENRYEALHDNSAGANIGNELLEGRLYVKTSSNTFTFLGSPAQISERMFVMRSPSRKQAKELLMEESAAVEVEKFRYMKECHLSGLTGADVFEVTLGEEADSARYVFIDKPMQKIAVLESRGYNFAFFTEGEDGVMKLRKVVTQKRGLVGFNFGNSKGAVRIWKEQQTKAVIKLFVSSTTNQLAFVYSLYDCYLNAEDIGPINVAVNKTERTSKPPPKPTPLPTPIPTQSRSAEPPKPTPTLPPPTATLPPPTATLPPPTAIILTGEPKHRILIEEDLPEQEENIIENNNIRIQKEAEEGGKLWIVTLVLVVFFLCTCVIYACIRGVDKSIPRYSMI